MFDFLTEYDILGAFWVTVQLTVYSAIGSLLWGTILAGMRVSPVPIMRAFGGAYVNIVRSIPLTLVIISMSLGLNQTLGAALGGDVLTTINFRLAVLGFVLYTSTFVCESLRSGINTVPVGQAEAARALGLNFGQVLRMIVLPQAFRSVIGPLTSVLIALTKNTTVASTIGVAEASLLMSEMIENESDVIGLVFMTFAMGFVILTLPIGLLLGRVAKKATVKR
ncbi:MULTISPECIES: amino acid ABC transporter permease [Prauserella salsuginis group]|uniref:Glutamate transport system permease protein n=2 Tax=Prauserella salsuginis group TaxID=2893672 RepID=A0A839XHD1_9PSEU|nr:MULTISPECIES: amino acid ABC transporter permease [Prauserella salsuginis group]MBB3661139.1 glutamate transport system permease protein [Prauserella sediminis]MCR3719003.1 glutamate transport system permease protein [Prauserella flava]MCR3733573.1 glutamate transport system permease protein [Prauserella salsuginis]